MSDEERLLRAAELIDTQLIARPATVFRDRLKKLWSEGLPPGSSTGWRSVDKHYTVAPGQLTIITGWPGSGKSEWLDAVLLNLARTGWRIALFSPENQPTEIHVVKFIEKFLGKPFGTGPTERMTEAEVDEATTEIEEWFSFLGPSFTSEKLSFFVPEILNAVEFDFRERNLWGGENKLGLVIDPWNELDHLRSYGMSETEYISQTLSMLRAWARKNSVHVWVVAHPQKLRRDDDGKLPIPRPDSISGSQHWWNKADACITVWRDLAEASKDETEIHVWKVRFKHIGKPGKIVLTYDRVSGRYHEKVTDFSVINGGVRGVGNF